MPEERPHPLSAARRPALPNPAPAPQVQLQGFFLCLEDMFRPPAPHRRALRARSCQQVSPGVLCLLSW